MSRIFVHGIGAVSPAGWGVAPLREAVLGKKTIEDRELARPGWTKPLRARQVPAPATRPAFLAHARFRRTSPISQFAVAAALEALGDDAASVSSGALRLGIVLCVMSGCVNYSRRFYDEVLKEPAMASPLIFPETVFNAPSSHLAALLGTTAINYTLVGDPGTFLQGLALAGDWLNQKQVDGCLVIGAEEMDWVTTDAFRLFARRIVLSEGAGAVYLRGASAPTAPVEMCGITDSYLFSDYSSRIAAAHKMKTDLPAGASEDLLCDGLQGIPRLDQPETNSWGDWPGARLSPKKFLGEGLMAASAWQCVAAVNALLQNSHRSAQISVVGCNQQAIGAQFVNVNFSRAN